MKRRTILFLAGSLAAAGLVPVLQVEAADAPVKVVVWGYQQNADMWKQIEQKLNESGANVSIQYRASDPQQYGAILQTALTGGSGPDIFAIGASSPAPYKYVAANQLAPLDGVIAKSNIPDRYYDYSTVDGKNYGVPFALLTIQGYYNKDLFQKEGVEPPRTWDDLIALCKKFEADGITPIAAMGQGAYGQASINWSAEALSGSLLGRQFIDDLEAKKKDFSDPVFVNFLTRLQELTQYYQPNWQASGATGTEMETYFATGQAAMMFGGIWDVAINFNKINPDLNVGLFVPPPMTASDSPYVDYIVDGVFAMNNNIQDPREKAAAEAIIKYTATPEFGTFYGQANSAISPINGVVNPQESPLVSEARKLIASSGAKDILGTGSPFMEPPLNTGTNVKAYDSVQSVAWTALPPMMRGEVSPADTAKQFQDRLSWYFAK
jgi:ABC-type glycerol-3-phosphate transport system substrate-binding protein